MTWNRVKYINTIELKDLGRCEWFEVTDDACEFTTDMCLNICDGEINITDINFMIYHKKLYWYDNVLKMMQNELNPNKYEEVDDESKEKWKESIDILKKNLSKAAQENMRKGGGLIPPDWMRRR